MTLAELIDFLRLLVEFGIFCVLVDWKAWVQEDDE